jgi:hypothetical protein
VVGLWLCGCAAPAQPGEMQSPSGAAGMPVAGAVGGDPGVAGTASPQAGATGALPGEAGAGAAGSTGVQGAAGTGSGEAGDGAAGTGVAGSQPVGGTGPGPDPEPTTGPFPPVTDFAQRGPYTSTTLTGTGPNNMYTVYMPMQPPPEGAKNPIVGWMSGGGTTHTLYTLPPHLASHGFVVVAADVVPGIGQEAMLGQQIIAGIDWAIAENARAGSPLFDRLDVTKIASSGYSMGSLATFMIAGDPRLTTTVHISGGNMAPERVNILHAPAAFICGTPGGASCSLISPSCDIAGANCAMDFENAQTPVFYATFASGHLGILSSPFMERINAMTTAWLRWHLMGDTTLRAKFAGDACAYCSDSNWQVRRKQLD